MQEHTVSPIDKTYFITLVFPGEYRFDFIPRGIDRGQSFAKVAKEVRVFAARNHNVKNPACIKWAVYEKVNGQFFIVAHSPTWNDFTVYGVQKI